MGQRHQIYVVTKNEGKYRATGAFHHQWCYGMRAPTNLVRAANLIFANKMDDGGWCEYSCRDSREIETVIAATYGVGLDSRISMVHNGAEYLIDGDNIMPSLGDNNDGASLIVIDNDKKEIRICLFTPGHLEGEYANNAPKNKAFSIDKYISYYYSDSDRAKKDFASNFAKNLDILSNSKFKTVSQVELNKILAYDLKSKQKKGA